VACRPAIPTRIVQAQPWSPKSMTAMQLKRLIQGLTEVLDRLFPGHDDSTPQFMTRNVTAGAAARERWATEELKRQSSTSIRRRRFREGVGSRRGCYDKRQSSADRIERSHHSLQAGSK